MTATIVVVAIVALAAAIAIIALGRSARGDGVAVPAHPPSAGSFLDDGFSSTGEPFAVDSVTPVAAEPSAAGPVAKSAPVAEPQAEAPAIPDVPAWPSQVVGRAEPLDDEARTRLLGDLGIVRAPWCVPILAQAYAEEPTPALRCAALLALVGLRGSAEARAVLAQAAASPDERERAIAAGALTNTPAAAP